ncbi:hypothetical protein ACJX0J_007844, partial [Zea mays]
KMTTTTTGHLVIIEFLGQKEAYNKCCNEMPSLDKHIFLLNTAYIFCNLQNGLWSKK